VTQKHFRLLYLRHSIFFQYSLLVIILLLPPAPSPAWGAAAQIKTITPSCAAVGQSVTLTGNGLGATNLTITVGGVTAPLVSATGNQATFVVPAGVVPAGVVPGMVAVIATNPGEHSGSIAFRVKGGEICGNQVDEDCDGQIEDACPPINHVPIANAGPDQTQPVGTSVQLDGAASSDPDGGGLTFQWTLSTRPSGSTAALSNPTIATPTFLIDRAGTYQLQLVVSDGYLTSTADVVIISTSNSAPIAQAGEGRSGQIGTTLLLDGSGSSDVDGNQLTFQWSLLSQPVGSTAILANPTTVNPMLTLDAIGDYVVQLVVHDGTVPSAPDTVILSTLNSTPVAKAGSDQSTTVGAVIYLDGSQSSDADGNTLSYQWGLTARPSGSIATFSDPTSVQPSFQIDKPGTYVAQLVVNDGFVSSVPDLVTISTLNTKPVAQAGADQSGQVGQTVTLDGSGSSDVDGDALTYQWSLLSKPLGSTATLVSPTSVTPSLTLDRTGTYVVQLYVKDGHTSSVPDTVVISTLNTRPVAEAGADQSSTVGAVATLDGSGSSDVDGDPLTYWWALTTKPTGSPTTLSDPTALQPSFVLDRPGTYAAQLMVSDGALDSAPDAVTISTLNVRPVADAGNDQYRRVGDVVTLDGLQSTDPDGDALTYQWNVVTKPAGSNVILQASTSIRPTFVLDRAGTYTLQLIVHDGQVDSEPDTVIVTTENTRPVANAGPDRTGQMGAPITLNGSASYDADGDALTYSWSLLDVPLGSPITLSNPTSVQAIFVSLQPGFYAVQLIVSDGTTTSDPSTVLITVGFGPPLPQNQPPVANAGPDQTIRLGQILQLDGNGSSDPNGDPLVYRWTLVSAPTGPAAFMQTNGSRLTFQAQTPGTYTLQLIVNDGVVDSAPDQVTLIVSDTANAVPVANAGPDQTVTLGTTVQLNGSGSLDANGDALTYAWRLTLKPTGSVAALNSLTSTTPTFRADVVGTYIAQLIVSDGFSSSMPDTVTITARASSDTTPPLPADLTRIGLSAIVGGQVTITGVGGAVEGSTRVTFTNLRTGQAVNVTAGTTGNFTARMAVQAGDLVSIVVTDAASNSSPARTLQVAANVQLTITAPVHGASLSGNRARVSGTVQGPLNTGVVVNGVVALVYNGVFVAENVTLVAGQNTITATATPLGGPSVQTQVTVASDEAPLLLEVEASPTSGIAPLEVTFTYQFGSTTPIQNLSLDVDGNGTFDFTTTDPNAVLQHTYTTPGLYLARLRVTDQSGAVAEAQTAIAVQDVGTLDALFKSMWNSMNAALVAGDISTALIFLDSAAREKYGPVWQVLLPHVTEIITSYSPIRGLSIGERVGEYGLNRTINGEKRLFLIYFLKNEDGVWRLNAM
jgi:hypothetical protein